MFDIHQFLFSIRRVISRKDILFILGLLILFFITRLINLNNFPIFTDEGIYIRWAKVAWLDPSWRFISLSDGKQPLHTWGIIPFLKLFPNDALLAGRLFSVLTGLTALVGMFSFCFYAFGKKAAYIGSLLYIFTPYFIFYDRLALIDSGVNAGFIWILFFSVLLANKRNLDIALTYGLIAGVTLLAKSSARLFVALSALAPILLYEKNNKKFIWKSINYYILLAIGVVIALVMYNIQRLSPFFHYISEKNATFVMTLPEFLENPFRIFFTNIYVIPTYVFWELGWIMAIFAALGIYMMSKKNWRLCLYLLLWLFIPYISIAFFAKVLFPRYLIFLATLVMIFATYYFSTIQKQKTLSIVLGIFMLTLVGLDYPLLFKAANAYLPPIDRGQYVEGPTAVWGAEEFMDFAREQSQEKPVLLLGEGNFGIIADILEVYKRPTDTRLEVKGVWPLNEEDIIEHQKVTDKKVYIVFPHREEFPAHWPIKLVKKYSKPNSSRALYVFEYK